MSEAAPPPGEGAAAAAAPATPAMDAVRILGALPHRYPFLLVDRVISSTAEETVALKNVSLNEPFFQGHFPGHPVMPGVLILEALAQAAALHAHARGAFDPATKLVYFMGLDKVRFRKPVVPGDQLMLHVRPLRAGGKVWKLSGEARVGMEVVAEAELLAGIVDR
jgi:3-hydroxyacyl-[acyl-carrier-protein] dehydratase